MDKKKDSNEMKTRTKTCISTDIRHQGVHLYALDWRRKYTDALCVHYNILLVAQKCLNYLLGLLKVGVVLIINKVISTFFLTFSCSATSLVTDDMCLPRSTIRI